MSTNFPAWPPPICVSDPVGMLHDYIEASDQIAHAGTDGTLSDQIGVVICEVGETKAFSVRSLRAPSELLDNLSPVTNAGLSKSTRIFIIPQRYSRGPLDITLHGLRSLLANTRAIPQVGKTIAAFGTSSGNSYIDRHNVSFSPHAESTNQLLQFTCLLKYVEKNERKGDLTPWSIRLLGCHHIYDLASQSETATLIHLSDAAWKRIKNAIKDDNDIYGTWKHWTRFLVLIFTSVLDGWQEYVTFLHDSASQMETNASFTDPKKISIGEVKHDSLKDCAAHIGVLRTASLALVSNIRVFEAALDESRKRRAWVCSTSMMDYDVFESILEDLIRELTYTRTRIETIRERREQTMATIRDLVSIRHAYTVEKLSGRSFAEARAVRIITVVTLVFLPATFASGFMDMNFIHVISVSHQGLLNLSADPDLLVYLAIALPLMVLTLGAWLFWEWFSSRGAERRDSDLA